MNKMVLAEAEKAGAHFLHRNGGLMSVDPPETMFGYTVWAHMIPPFKPNHTLMLGYGAGTTAHLMRKIFGADCKITGVDIEPHDFKFTGDRIKTIDAKEYVWNETTGFFKSKFDYICVDLWDGPDVCDFVFDVEFAVRLREMAKKLISMNIKAVDLPRLMPYHDYGFQYDRSVPVENNQVIWWSVAEGGNYGEEKAQGQEMLK